MHAWLFGSGGLNAWDESCIRIALGWLNETLSTAPIRAIAFLCLNGDFSDFTIAVLLSCSHDCSPSGAVQSRLHGGTCREGLRAALPLRQWCRCTFG
jgi:hypothetical protein